MEHTLYLLAGGNLGDRVQYLLSAKSHVGTSIGPVLRSSGLHESEPWGFSSENLFLNQVWEVRSLLPPLEILNLLHKIEYSCGRRPDLSTGYNSRTLDLDILLYDNIVWNTPELTIPHPLLHQRRFALVPLAELIPEYMHPVLQTSIGELLEKCRDTLSVEARPH